MKSLSRLAIVAATIVLIAGCSDDASESTSDATTTTAADSADTSADAAADLELTSSAFEDGAAIPAQFTCDGDNQQPPLNWAEAPDDAEQMVLIVDDPDAPGGSFIHWVIWDLASEGGIAEGQVPDTAVQGTNDLDTTEWFGPCPPPGETHHYEFQLAAVSEAPDVEGGATAEEVRAAIGPTTLADTVLVGTYQRA
jgi:Raf kinase inhibitor-like YbhB/YbcL family protein